MFGLRKPLMSSETVADELSDASELLRRVDRILSNVAMRAPSDLGSRLAQAERDLEGADTATHALRLRDLAAAIRGEIAEAEEADDRRRDNPLEHDFRRLGQ